MSCNSRKITLKKYNKKFRFVLKTQKSNKHIHKSNHQLIHFTPVEYIEKPSINIKPKIEMVQINTTPSWQNSITNYLVDRTLLEDKLELRSLQTKVARNYMWKWNDMLVRKPFDRPYPLCLKYP